MNKQEQINEDFKNLQESVKMFHQSVRDCIKCVSSFYDKLDKLDEVLSQTQEVNGEKKKSPASARKPKQDLSAGGYPGLFEEFWRWRWKTFCGSKSEAFKEWKKVVKGEDVKYKGLLICRLIDYKNAYEARLANGGTNPLAVSRWLKRRLFEQEVESVYVEKKDFFDTVK